MLRIFRKHQGKKFKIQTWFHPSERFNSVDNMYGCAWSIMHGGQNILKDAFKHDTAVYQSLR